MDPRQDFEPGPPPRVTTEALRAGLAQVGIESGDLVAVHVSLSSMGRLEGRAEAFLDALQTALGAGGTLVVPRFVHYVGFQIYDPHDLPPTETGQVGDRLLQRPGAILSLQPSHPVVAAGPRARAVTEGHYRASPVGIDSPFDRLARLGGKVLLVGVNQRVNTTIHVGEAYAGVPYWGRPRPDRPDGLWMLDEHGDKHWVRLDEVPGDSYGFARIEPFLEARGLIRYGRIGRARLRVMPGQELIDAVVEYLGQEPGGLLCHRPECVFCTWARQFVPPRGSELPAPGDEDHICRARYRRNETCPTLSW